MYAFQRLDADLSCDVAVVGAGITGALIADELADHGHDVVVLDQRDVDWGSTAASTALLQYEIDIHATDLARLCDQASALLAYQSCWRAISEIGAVADYVGNGLQHARLRIAARADRTPPAPIDSTVLLCPAGMNCPSAG